jgi:L-ascorbate metabolism protein UlaG (beta-lactamase superfamily)
VEWYGHSCFLLTLENGAKILIDPYDTTRVPYPPPRDRVEVIFSTHDHFDHNNVNLVPARIILRADGSEAKFFGKTGGTVQQTDGSTVVDLNGKILKAITVPSFHDERKGGQRGANGMLRFTLEDVTFAHLGDIGTMLTPEQIQALKPVDVLIIPVGGYYTIDADTAQQIVAALEPRIVIPMHYNTDRLGESWPIETADKFLAKFTRVQQNPGSTLTLRADQLPDSLTVEALRYHGQK